MPERFSLPENPTQNNNPHETLNSMELYGSFKKEYIELLRTGSSPQELALNSYTIMDNTPELLEDPNVQSEALKSFERILAKKNKTLDDVSWPLFLKDNILFQMEGYEEKISTIILDSINETFETEDFAMTLKIATSLLPQFHEYPVSPEFTKKLISRLEELINKDDPNLKNENGTYANVYDIAKLAEDYMSLKDNPDYRDVLYFHYAKVVSDESENRSTHMRRFLSRPEDDLEKTEKAYDTIDKILLRYTQRKITEDEEFISFLKTDSTDLLKDSRVITALIYKISTDLSSGRLFYTKDELSSYKELIPAESHERFDETLIFVATKKMEEFIKSQDIEKASTFQELIKDELSYAENMAFSIFGDFLTYDLFVEMRELNNGDHIGPELEKIGLAKTGPAGIMELQEKVASLKRDFVGHDLNTKSLLESDFKTNFFLHYTGYSGAEWGHTNKDSFVRLLKNYNLSKDNDNLRKLPEEFDDVETISVEKKRKKHTYR